jgi:hypothetical protein
MVIFHSYVKLPEGIHCDHRSTPRFFLVNLGFPVTCPRKIPFNGLVQAKICADVTGKKGCKWRRTWNQNLETGGGLSMVLFITQE